MAPNGILPSTKDIELQHILARVVEEPSTKLQLMLNSATFHGPTAHTLESLLVPQWLEYNAIHSPDYVLFAFESPLGSGEIKTTTWREAYSAFQKAAEYTSSGLGAFERPLVIGILANLDSLTYYACLAGIWLAGAIPFPISPRNSPAAVAHLLSCSHVSALFVSSDGQIQSLASAALHELTQSQGGRSPDIKIRPTPKHEELYNSVPVLQHSLNISRNVTLDSPAFILHSSGSTAFPKPITITHQALRQWANAPLSSDANREAFGLRMAMHAVPVFHTMGALVFVLTVTGGLSLGLFPPAEPRIIPSPDNFLASSVACKCDVLLAAPSFIEQWSQQSKYIEALKTFKIVAFGGGPLDSKTGDDLVCEGVRIASYYGTTEVGTVIPYLYEPYQDWEWITLSYARTTPYFRLIEGEANKFELVFLEGPHHTPSILNTEVHDVMGYATGDLVARHPTDPRKIKILGRVDDQIILSTGEKTNPGPLESIINRNPLVRASLMFGYGRDQNGVILQPVKPVNDQKALSAFRDAVWPSIVEANECAPSHSHVFMEMIIVMRPDKPFHLTPKGSIKRKTTLEMYATEIEELYRTVTKSAQPYLAGPSNWSYDGLHDFVRRVVLMVMEKDIGDDEDMFVRGADSLRATWIRNAFLRALQQSHYSACANSIGQGFVYSHPTIFQLTSAMDNLVSEVQTDTLSRKAIIQKRLQAIESLVAEFTSYFPTHRAAADSVQSNVGQEDEIVMITGTTGGLGAQLLSTFSAIPSVKKIYAVNRPSTQPLYQRQKRALHERGLDVSVLDSGNLVLVEGNTEIAGFGISRELYEEIRDSVTLIVHNAWRVNFVLQLASFKPLLQATRNIVDFALASPKSAPPRILYISSISIFSSWGSKERPVEGAIPAQFAIGNGYSESKYIGERILQAASAVTPLAPVCIRIGQMTGTESGAWNSTDWVPAIVRSGQVLGMLPNRDDDVAWISLGLASQAVCDFRNSPDTHLNLEHPVPYPWSSVFRAFSRALDVPLASWSGWLQNLEGVNASDVDNTPLRNPAAHLIPLFKGVAAETNTEFKGLDNTPRMAMEKALASSESLRRAASQSIDIEGEVHRWIAHWKAVGLLD